jgi:hypothetical protein
LDKLLVCVIVAAVVGNSLLVEAVSPVVTSILLVPLGVLGDIDIAVESVSNNEFSASA